MTAKKDSLGRSYTAKVNTCNNDPGYAGKEVLWWGEKWPRKASKAKKGKEVLTKTYKKRYQFVKAKGVDKEKRPSDGNIKISILFVSATV